MAIKKNPIYWIFSLCTPKFAPKIGRFFLPLKKLRHNAILSIPKIRLFGFSLSRRKLPLFYRKSPLMGGFLL